MYAQDALCPNGWVVATTLNDKPFFPGFARFISGPAFTRPRNAEARVARAVKDVVVFIFAKAVSKKGNAVEGMCASKQKKKNAVVENVKGETTRACAKRKKRQEKERKKKNEVEDDPVDQQTAPRGPLRARF